MSNVKVSVDAFTKEELYDFVGPSWTGKLGAVRLLRGYFNIFNLMQAKFLVEVIVEICFGKSYEEVQYLISNRPNNDVIVTTFQDLHWGAKFVSTTSYTCKKYKLFLKTNTYQGVCINDGEIVGFDPSNRVIVVN